MCEVAVEVELIAPKERRVVRVRVGLHLGLDELEELVGVRKEDEALLALSAVRHVVAAALAAVLAKREPLLARLAHLASPLRLGARLTREVVLLPAQQPPQAVRRDVAALCEVVLKRAALEEGGVCRDAVLEHRVHHRLAADVDESEHEFAHVVEVVGAVALRDVVQPRE